MKTSLFLSVGLSLCLALALLPAPAQAGDAGMIVVNDVVPLMENGGRVDWDRSGSNRIAMDRPGPDGYFDVWTMDPDGGGPVNLTQDKPGLPQKHNGNPAWHPSGRYIVFQAQKESTPEKLDPQCQPGAGVLNDLYLMTADGSRFWPLVVVEDRLDKDVPAVLHPHFSPDGKMLIWSERVRANDSPLGEWVIKLADFNMTDEGPRLAGVRPVNPGGKSSFFETNSFSPDGKGFLYTGSQNGGLDIYYYDLSSGESRRLTKSPETWDEQAHFTPDGKDIVWASSKDLSISLEPLDLRTELWIMYPEGACQRRLTHFHQAGHAHFQHEKRAVAGDSTFSPDGKRLLLFILNGDPAGPDRGRGYNVMIELGLGAAFCPLD